MSDKYRHMRKNIFIKKGLILFITLRSVVYGAFTSGHTLKWPYALKFKHYIL